MPSGRPLERTISAAVEATTLDSEEETAEAAATHVEAGVAMLAEEAATEQTADQATAVERAALAEAVAAADAATAAEAAKAAPLAEEATVAAEAALAKEAAVVEEAAVAAEAAWLCDEDCECVAELVVSEIIDKLVIEQSLAEEEPDWLKEAAEQVSLSREPPPATEGQPEPPPQPELSSPSQPMPHASSEDVGAAADAEHTTAAIQTPQQPAAFRFARSPSSSFSPSSLSPAVKRGAVTGLLAAGTAVLFTVAAKRGR